MIFVDTWAWRARAFPRDDPWARQALPVWRKFSRTYPTLLTTWMVVDETINAVIHRAGSGAGVVAYQQILATPRLTIQKFDDRIYQAALELLRQYADQRMTLADAASFVTMRQHRCDTAFTGDKHFRIAGFQTTPECR